MEFIQTFLLICILVAVISFRPAQKRTKTTPAVIIDSCGLIDGRIIELAAAAFIPAKVVIPGFVIKELQSLADQSDPQRRERGRFGLDVAKQLQAGNYPEVIIDESDSREGMQVDDQLVALAKKLQAKLYTTDYNLNKVADLHNISVLNVNELALALRPVAIPGEKKEITIVQKGNGDKQGVGYLDDGTMVVVEGAVGLNGKSVTVVITRIHQTLAGKMLFADVADKTILKPKTQSRKSRPAVNSLHKRLRTR